MKKVLLLIIAAAIGIGIVMLMQSNKMPKNGQSSTMAPITNDTMTPAPAAAPAAPAHNDMMESKPATPAAPAMDNAPAAAPAAPAMDNTPAAAPASDATVPPTDNMQDNAAMHHSMTNDTQAAPASTSGSTSTTAPATGDQNNGASNIEQKMESTMNGAAGNPGAPINNVNESTK